MTLQTRSQLGLKHCEPCDGNMEPFSRTQAREQIESLAGWELAEDGRSIEKHWVMLDFVAAVGFLNQVGQLAEQQGHHPDFHLERYRHVRIVLSTHAVGGLSENDFIMAAKIDQLPAIVKA